MGRRAAAEVVSTDSSVDSAVSIVAEQEHSAMTSSSFDLNGGTFRLIGVDTSVTPNRTYPSAPVFEVHGSGLVMAMGGMFATVANSGQPVTADASASWSIPSDELLDQIERAEWMHRANIPVRPIRGGYAAGLTAPGYVVKLQADDAVALGCDLSEAYVVRNNQLAEIITGVLFITQDAYLRLLSLAGRINVLGEEKDTKPFTATDLPAELDNLRANGPTIHPGGWNGNGFNRDGTAAPSKIGFRAGTQRNVGEAATLASTLAAQSIFNQVAVSAAPLQQQATTPAGQTSNYGRNGGGFYPRNAQRGYKV